ncbi:MAG: T9SS type A sorting domain-containing protein, partial [Cyclobacteriaceae bacterium]|nr:T9SS type A sorting domain-containing protein [Cyclobacteriaceae bacterium]
MGKTILVLLLLTGSFLTTIAQHATLSTGGEASGSGGTSSYSIGQFVYTTNQGVTGSITQGVQQPFIIEAITGLDELGISLNLIAYPNPATDFVQLKVESEMLTDFSYQLYNMQGKMLGSNKLTEIQTGIDMTSLSPAT